VNHSCMVSELVGYDDLPIGPSRAIPKKWMFSYSGVKNWTLWKRPCGVTRGDMQGPKEGGFVSYGKSGSSANGKGIKKKETSFHPRGRLFNINTKCRGRDLCN